MERGSVGVRGQDLWACHMGEGAGAARARQKLAREGCKP